MSFDVINALTTGGTVAGAIKVIGMMENFLAARKNGNGGRGSAADLRLQDHDTLRDISKGVDTLHNDLAELRQDLRDCMNGR